ncbi:hypothetical protein L1I79_27230 [Strepomyces sp. STD 3.1]|nr:hypothetical protein [Streptomyces sp. STD 3.1]
MAETTQTASTPPTPTSDGYCSWHQRIAKDVQRIQLTEAGSGGKVHYACPPCIGIWKLTPYADQ